MIGVTALIVVAAIYAKDIEKWLRPEEPEVANVTPAPIPPPPPSEPEPDTTPVDPERQRQERINKTIDRGVEFLKRELTGLLGPNVKDPPELLLGYASFAALSLLHSEVPASDPVIQKVLAKVRSLVG
ncbi:MAG: hypothetical protein AB7K24_22750, partial [Gemmataceae bacterium]